MINSQSAEYAPMRSAAVYGLTMRLRQNGRHFPDAIFQCIFLNENIWISIKISLKFVPKGTTEYSSIGLDNGLAPDRWQAIIWTNDG